MDILKLECIAMGLPAESREQAIQRSGQMLVDGGYVNPRYIEGMLERDNSLTTAIGNCLAIPHGEKQYKECILNTGIVVCAYPEGIDWNGTKVHLVIGIAANGDDHLKILENIADKMESEDDVIDLAGNATADEMMSILSA